MKRLTAQELKSLNECVYHTLNQDQLDENLLRALASGIARSGRVALRTTTAAGRQINKQALGRAISRPGIAVRRGFRDLKDKIVDVATGGTQGRLATRRQNISVAAQRREAARLGQVSTDVGDALAAGSRGPMTTADALRNAEAQRLLNAGDPDAARRVILGGGQAGAGGAAGAAGTAATSGPGALTTAAAAAAGTQLPSIFGGKGVIAGGLEDVRNSATQGMQDVLFRTAARNLRGRPASVQRSLGIDRLIGQ
jgi:hypothetical protein